MRRRGAGPAALLGGLLAVAPGCQTTPPAEPWADPAGRPARLLPIEPPARPAAAPVVPASYVEPVQPAPAQPALPLPAPAQLAPAQPALPLPAPAQLAPPPRPVDRGTGVVGSEPPPPPAPGPSLRGAPASVGGPLGLDEVLDAVVAHYPLLRAVEQERAIAGGRLLSSMGVFDLNLTGGADGQGGTYDNFRGGVGVSRGLPVAGLGAFAGYRNGYGDFPTYNLGQKTADGGEFRAGVTVPLLQGRAIDRPRANVEQAGIDVRLAEPVIERQRLDFVRAAARTYWNWVAAGQRLEVARRLAALADERDAQLRARVEAGPVANIDRVDNQQNIALRNGVVVQAERAFQQATIDLSLFLRDAAGGPTLAGADRLPAFPEVRPVDPGAFDAALQTAVDLRPEPRRLRLQRDRVGVDLRLATNQTLPTLNGVAAISQDVGDGRSSLSGPNGLDRTTATAGLALQLPIQRRDARGREAAARAQIAQLDQQIRNAEDVVRADVQDAFSALERAAEFSLQAGRRVELARLVARAEREQLRLGRSDVLRVTLREQAAFDAEIVEIGARQDYFRAAADLRAATGEAGR